ncbi:MAG: glycosyltransferase family 2 protein [Candidatus Levybacteria bacterium]|nr:glycosyltransferase family 2 protein [Candidatus Levybacteria bacterium]
MSRITGIVIAKNEEERIADCLDSLSFCDEIIVVDNVSEDRTAQIAERMGAKVTKADSKDFSELRNTGLKIATGDWVLYVDADERVTSELARNIKYQISNIKYSEIVAYKVTRKNFYLGNHEWPQQEKMERLFKRAGFKGWRGKLHESPVIEGKVSELTGFLLHYTHRNLSQMLRKTIEWSKIEAELRYSAGHPKMSWWRFPRIMITTFCNYYFVQRGFKVGTVGLIESMYQAFSIFTTYARLWELQRKK